MGVLEIILIGIALSMDAAAVSMSNAMVHRGKRRRLVEMAFWFGFFQGLMPLLGYFLGNAFHDVLSMFGDIIVAVIFAFIGVKMIMEACHEGDESCPIKELTHKLLLIQAVATSIDAFAVGVGFSAQQVNIWFAVAVIAVTTFLLSLAAVYIGRIFGDMLGCKAEILGGVILIILGLKSFF